MLCVLRLAGVSHGKELVALDGHGRDATDGDRVVRKLQ